MVMDKTRDSAIKLFGKTIPVGVSGSDGYGGGHIHECLREAESVHEEEEEEDDSEQSPSKRDRVLPCPRCSSSDTKFCYFNNSNPNQPRHYCKKCQRYWTAGGTMRNVPVGSGRRKAKRTASPARTDAKVVSFIPISNQMEAPKEDCDEQSSGSSVVTASSCTDGGTGFDPQAAAIGSHQEIPTQIPYLIGSPWPYPSPAFYNSSFPVPVMYPAPAYWAIPWFAPMPPPATSNSTTLGKHPREQDVMKDRDSEKGCLWAPKTTRIGDLEEAAKISIWSGLGFKNDKAKTGIKSQRADCFSVLHANPAALSRSLNFQESS